MRCQLCHETFNLFDTIVLPLACESRNLQTDAKPHYFHVCCIDIIAQEHDDKEEEYKRNDQFAPNLNCIVCTTVTEHEKEDERLLE